MVHGSSFMVHGSSFIVYHTLFIAVFKPSIHPFERIITALVKSQLKRYFLSMASPKRWNFTIRQTMDLKRYNAGMG